MQDKNYSKHSKMTTKCTLIMHYRSKIILSQVRSICVFVMQMAFQIVTDDQDRKKSNINHVHHNPCSVVGAIDG